MESLKTSWRIGRLKGVDIRLHFSIVLVAPLMFYLLSPENPWDWLLLLIEFAGFLISVLLHEVGHALDGPALWDCRRTNRAVAAGRSYWNEPRSREAWPTIPDWCVRPIGERLVCPAARGVLGGRPVSTLVVDLSGSRLGRFDLPNSHRTGLPEYRAGRDQSPAPLSAGWRRHVQCASGGRFRQASGEHSQHGGRNSGRARPDCRRRCHA